MLRANTRRYLLLGLLLGAFAWATMALIAVFAPVTDFVYGFIAGIYLAMFVALVCYSLMLDGSHLRSMGAEAERWTSEELRKIHGWTVIDAIEFADRDIDHVAIGPAQILAVETKWTSRPVTIKDAGVAGLWCDGEAHAARAAKRIQAFLASRGVDHPVIPLLLLWGPGVPTIEGGYRRVGDVRVVVGWQADEWRDRLENLPTGHGQPSGSRSSSKRMCRSSIAAIARALSLPCEACCNRADIRARALQSSRCWKFPRPS